MGGAALQKKQSRAKPVRFQTNVQTMVPNEGSKRTFKRESPKRTFKREGPKRTFKREGPIPTLGPCTLRPPSLTVILFTRVLTQN